jgi:hypothetical protein
MPKSTLQISDIGPISSIAAGTYTNIRSIQIDSTGVITAISTYTPGGGGLISSVNGTSGQISVNPTIGIPQVDLVSISSPITNAQIQSITTDQYGRISSFTTSSVASGTFSSINSITVNSAGRITSISTGSASPVAIPNNSTLTNAILNSSTTIISSREPVYIFSNSQSGIITLDLTTATNFYMVPSGNFSFNFINGPNLAGLTFNIGQLSSYTPIVSVSIVVNNIGGYSWYPNFTGNTYKGWSYNGSIPDYPQWAMGLAPTGTSGRIEIYNFIFNQYYYSSLYRLRSYATMVTYG